MRASGSHKLKYSRLTPHALLRQVNNAGFTFDKMLHTMSDDAFELMLKVHNTAPFRVIREAAPYLRSKDPVKMKENKSIVSRLCRPL